jgi:predicted DNA-binding transcriptional regulator YafY
MAHCIANKLAIEMEYLSLSNEVSKRIFHPYKLFMYNNAWFIIGFDEKRGDFRYFKLNRIKDFNITNQKFRIPLTYNERDFIDEFGMRQNGEWHPIKLKITGKYAMLVKERIYGKNQTVDAIDKGTSMLSVEMQNKEDILVFVLGFGANCEVIEPAWLREKVLTTVSNIQNAYL